MRYLITGAQGFVGCFLRSEISRRNRSAIILGIGRSNPTEEFFSHTITRHGEQVQAPLPRSLRSEDLPNYSYVQQDIRDRDGIARLIKEFQPNVIFNLASSLRDAPVESLCRTNIEGAVTLLEAAAQWSDSATRIILGSSGGVYGVPDYLPIAETNNTSPIDLYSVSKLAGELAARTIARTHELHVVTARIFNIVGPGEDERHACARFATQLAAGVAAETKIELSTGSLTPTRDFIDVRDVARALVLLSMHGELGHNYNVASGIETSIDTVVQRQIELVNIDVEVRDNQYARPNDIPRHYADVSRLTSLGFAPKFSLNDSLKALMDYYSQLYGATK